MKSLVLLFGLFSSSAFAVCEYPGAFVDRGATDRWFLLGEADAPAEDTEEACESACDKKYSKSAKTPYACVSDVQFAFGRGWCRCLTKDITKTFK